ncbi:hCG2039148 [Homo sapiens]|nr:hCG2039148 [Homo sapiens]
MWWLRTLLSPSEAGVLKSVSRWQHPAFCWLFRQQRRAGGFLSQHLLHRISRSQNLSFPRVDIFCVTTPLVPPKWMLSLGTPPAGVTLRVPAPPFRQAEFSWSRHILFLGASIFSVAAALW